MLIKLRKDAKIHQDKKHLLVLSDYDPKLVKTLHSEGESFWNSTLYFVEDLKQVEWQLENEMFDFLYAPLEKIGLIDKKLLNLY